MAEDGPSDKDLIEFLVGSRWDLEAAVLDLKESPADEPDGAEGNKEE